MSVLKDALSFLTFTRESRLFFEMTVFYCDLNDFIVKQNKNKWIWKYYITINLLLAFSKRNQSISFGIFNISICILHSCNLCVYSLCSAIFFGRSKSLALLPSLCPEDPTPWYLTHFSLKQCFSNCVSHEINLVSHSQHSVSLRKK